MVATSILRVLKQKPVLNIVYYVYIHTEDKKGEKVICPVENIATPKPTRL